jgi:hypothetical protein
VYATSDHVILDMTSEDEPGDEYEDLESSLSGIVGARSEFAADDLRPRRRSPGRPGRRCAHC